MKRIVFIAICVACSPLGVAHAFEVERATAAFENGSYRVDLTLLLDAPTDRVENVIRDYENYPILDASILESKVIERDGAQSLLLFTKLRGCSGLLCRTVHRVERVTESHYELLAVVVPEKSNVTAGSTHTVLLPEESRTRVRYQTTLEPNFWVPSWVGRPMMLRTLKDASLNMFRRIETRARELEQGTR